MRSRSAWEPESHHRPKQTTEQVLRRDPAETGLGYVLVSSVFVGHKGSWVWGGKISPRHRELRTPLTLPFVPPRPASPSGQYALEKEGKTHKNLPNKINMRCRQRPCWVGQTRSFRCSPMGQTHQKWLVAAEKCVISCSRQELAVSTPPLQKKNKQKKKRLSLWGSHGKGSRDMSLASRSPLRSYWLPAGQSGRLGTGLTCWRCPGSCFK